MYFTLTWTMRFLGTFLLGVGSRKVKLDSGQCFSVVVVFLSVMALNETLSEWEMRCRHTFCLIHCASQLGVWDRQLCWSAGAGWSGFGPTLHLCWASISRGSRKEVCFPQDLCGVLENNGSPLIHFALVVTDFSQYFFFFLSSHFPFHGGFLKDTVHTKKPFSAPIFWSLCPKFSMGGVSVHWKTHFNESNVCASSTEQTELNSVA